MVALLYPQGQGGAKFFLRRGGPRCSLFLFCSAALSGSQSVALDYRAGRKKVGQELKAPDLPSCISATCSRLPATSFIPKFSGIFLLPPDKGFLNDNPEPRLRENPSP